MDIFNLGLEELREDLDLNDQEATEIGERLQVLNDRMEDIQRTGLISRAQARLLVESSVPLDTNRYPVQSFTEEPTTTNVRPALESASEAQRGLIGRMIDALIAAYKRVVSWLKEHFAKFRDWLNSLAGKQSQKVVDNASTIVREVNTMGPDLYKAARSAMGEDREVVARLDAAWEKYQNAEMELSQKVASNVLLVNGLFTDRELREDVKSLMVALPSIVKTLKASSEANFKRLQQLISQEEMPVEDADKLYHDIEQSWSHPLSTKLLAKYGDGEKSHTPDASEGIEALISHLFKVGKDDTMNVDWLELPESAFDSLRDLLPSKLIAGAEGQLLMNAFGGADIEDNLLKFRMQTVENMSTNYSRHKSAELIQLLIRAYQVQLKIIQQVSRLELTLGTAAVKIAKALEKRVSNFEDFYFACQTASKGMDGLTEVRKRFSARSEKLAGLVRSVRSDE